MMLCPKETLMSTLIAPPAWDSARFRTWRTTNLCQCAKCGCCGRSSAADTLTHRPPPSIPSCSQATRLTGTPDNACPTENFDRRDQRADCFVSRAAGRSYASRPRPFHFAKPRARHERQLCWPQQRRASVCGSAAALRSGFVPAVSPSALHFFRSPTADRSRLRKI